MAKRPKDTTHPVDAKVGEKLRQLRVMQGLSQSELGSTLGISFQQIQKYEHGKNRISASMLYDISQALAIHPGQFFDDMEPSSSSTELPAANREILVLIQHYTAVPSKALRSAFVELLKITNSEA